MDSIKEKIYYGALVAVFIFNIFMLMFLVMELITGFWEFYVYYVVATLILFLLCKLFIERLDTTLQMYLIIMSAVFLIFLFWAPSFWAGASFVGAAIISFSSAFFLDDIYEKE